MGEALHPLPFSIIDCTSEDAKHPVNNLISTEDLTKRLSKGWRCEKYIFIIKIIYQNTGEQIILLNLLLDFHHVHKSEN